MQNSTSSLSGSKPISIRANNNWLSDSDLIAVAVGDPRRGATFVPHLGPSDYPQYRNNFLPITSPRGHKPKIPAHVKGGLTGNKYLDLCCWLCGSARTQAWLGTLHEAKRQGLVRPVFVEFKKFGPGLGYIPSKWNTANLPDRIAIAGFTACGRVEINNKINDGRNYSIYDTVLQWSEIQSAT